MGARHSAAGCKRAVQGCGTHLVVLQVNLFKVLKSLRQSPLQRQRAVEAVALQRQDLQLGHRLRPRAR